MVRATAAYRPPRGAAGFHQAGDIKEDGCKRELASKLVFCQTSAGVTEMKAFSGLVLTLTCRNAKWAHHKFKWNHDGGERK